MAVNEVIYNGKTLINLKNDTVTPETLAEGVTAHNASGEVIIGTMPTTSVLYTAQTLTDAQKAQARENIGIGEEYRAQLIQDILNAIGCPVFGIVDENNNIILTGALPDATYSVKYEMEDGSKVDIGDLVLDTNVYYSVVNTLTNCTNSNSTSQVIEGESYSATITAKDGYELKSVTVTMGGSPVSVSGGTINIASVTGNIVITAVAEEKAIVDPTNFCVVDGDGWITGGRCSSAGADRKDSATTNLTNYIAVQSGDIVYVKNFDISTATYSGIYKADKTAISGFIMTASGSAGYVKDINLSGEWEQFTIDNANAGYVRICGTNSLTSADIIVNIKRNGEWL